MLAYLRFPYLALLITGAVVAVLASATSIALLRRGREWHEQDVLIRKLWALVKRIPCGCVLADPDTGDLLTIERERWCLTLAVIDPPDPFGPD